MKDYGLLTEWQSKMDARTGKSGKDKNIVGNFYYAKNKIDEADSINMYNKEKVCNVYMCSFYQVQ